MRLIDLNEEIKTTYEQAVRAVNSDEIMPFSYGTREAVRLLLEDFQKRGVSCTSDERLLRDLYGNYFMGVAGDWRDLYESIHDHIVDEAKVDDHAAQAVLAVAELAYALLVK